MTFANCTEAYAAGYANMKKGVSKEYANHLDGHGKGEPDGIACENPPANFVPHHAASQTQSGGTVQHAGTAVQTDNRLPQTGPGEVGILGTLALALGVGVVLVVRRRKVRFQAS